MSFLFMYMWYHIISKRKGGDVMSDCEMCCCHENIVEVVFNTLEDGGQTPLVDISASPVEEDTLSSDDEPP